MFRYYEVKMVYIMSLFRNQDKSLAENKKLKVYEGWFDPPSV